ncbi:hypothetical protein [Saezia sanguinis]|uniref:hypothetical protein n=1 Tax=Saezia sanguinis TaxID=1965230 RepID=UPI0030380285
MNHDQVMLGYYIALFAVLPLAFLVFLYLMVHVLKKVNTLNLPPSTTVVGGQVFIRSIPAIVVLIILTIPVFYFSHLVKQEDYCKTVIAVNHITSRDNRMLQERCSSFDIGKLIEEVNQQAAQATQ